MKFKICNMGGSEEEKYWPQYMAVLFGCLASLDSGLLFGWSSPFIVKITSDNVTYNISESEASYFASIPTIATLVSCIFFAMLCDIIGRKTTLLLTAIPAITAWLLKAFAKDVTLFYLARVFVGIDGGCFFVALPIYVGEITSPNIRALLGSFITSFYLLGQLFINVLGNYFTVSTTSFICLPVPIIFVVLFYFMPESPYFYIMKDKNAEAKTSLWRLRRKVNTEEDFLQLQRDVKRQLSERGTWKDLFMIPSNRKAVLLGIFLRTAQFMGGTAVFLSSVQFIFEKSNGSVPSSTAAMVYHLCGCILFLCVGPVLEKIGRRPALTISLIVTSVLLLLEAVYFYINEFHLEIDASPFNWFPLTGMILYSAFASFGLGNIPTIMISELFSTSIKAKANIFMMLTVSAMSSLSVFIFFEMYPVTGMGGPFLLFVIVNLVCSVISHFCVPETKGKTLEEIQQMLKNN